MQLGATSSPVIVGADAHPASIASHAGPHGHHHGSQLDYLLRNFARKAVRAAKSARQRDRTIKLHAKVDLQNTEGKVAQVYFATDSSEIGLNDRKVLAAVYNKYAHILNGDSLLPARVAMRFVGYADYRGTEKHNAPLREQRAQAVAYLFAALRNSDGYSYKIEKGDVEKPQAGTTGLELVAFRRVDVFAYPHAKPPPKPEPQPTESVVATSTRWKYRFLVGVVTPGIEAGLRKLAIRWLRKLEVGGSVMLVEICDFDNKIAMKFTYVGGGPSLGSGISTSSEWDRFESSAPLNILDLEGPVFHCGGAAQLLGGPAGDYMYLAGPKVKGQANGISLKGFEMLGIGITFEVEKEEWYEKLPKWHIAAGFDFGFLAPLTRPRRVEEDYAGEWEEEESGISKQLRSTSVGRKLDFYISLLR